MAEFDPIQILINGGLAGVSIALIFLVKDLLKMMFNHLSSFEKNLTKALGGLKKEIKGLRKDLRNGVKK